MRFFGFPALLAGVLVSASALASPRVVATIAPVHSLAAAIMEGVGEPRLLLTGNASPHSYNMRPSQARMLAEAELVIWVGPQLETFLAKPLKNLGGRARVLAMTDTPGLLRLPVREGGIWETDHDNHGHESETSFDSHLWLEPDNAREFAAHVTQALIALDPANEPAYRRNSGRLSQELDDLDADMRRLLAPVAAEPFLVFHDAYQYIEHRYGLAAVGAITVAGDRQPGARRVAAIRQRMITSSVKCLFREPQFPSRIIEPLTEGLNVRVGVLDPLGAQVPSGPRHYPAMMRALAQTLHDCLAAPR